MKNIPYVFSLILLGVAIFFYAQSCNRGIKIEKADERYAALVDSVKNINPTRDTVWKLQEPKDTLPIYQRQEPISVDIEKCPRKEVKGNYTTDLLAIRWRAVVFGELESIEILPTSSYRFPEITIQKTVTIEDRKCPQEQKKEQALRLYFKAGVGFSREMIRNTDLELIVVHRRGFGLYGGMGYDTDIYYRAGIVLKIK